MMAGNHQGRGHAVGDGDGGGMAGMLTGPIIVACQWNCGKKLSVMIFAMALQPAACSLAVVARFGRGATYKIFTNGTSRAGRGRVTIKPNRQHSIQIIQSIHVIQAQRSTTKSPNRDAARGQGDGRATAKRGFETPLRRCPTWPSGRHRRQRWRCHRGGGVETESDREKLTGPGP